MSRIQIELQNRNSRRGEALIFASCEPRYLSDAQGSQRGLDYDALSEKYSTFTETEVLPHIAKDYNVKFTTEPERRAAM